MTPKFVATISQRMFRETNDCTVRAIGAAIGLDYATAHLLASRAGRKPRRGFWVHQILHQAKQESMIRDFSVVRMSGTSPTSGTTGNYHAACQYPTLNQSLPLLQTGRYVLSTTNHSFAVVDGVVYDNFYYRPKCRIQKIFEIKLEE